VRYTRHKGLWVIDYYKIVRRSVAALNPDTEATRQALYERARAALAKQLCLKNPPLPDSNIRAELSALEEAIKKVESEAWSNRYEIKDKKEIAGANKELTRPKRSAVFRFAPTALMLAVGAAYFVLWMDSSGSDSTAAALVLLSVFVIPAVFVFIFVIYPILSPLLWMLRWLNKKLLQRLTGGETIANATGATVLSAALCAIVALQAPSLFSWWAAGWCWIGCVFLLTLDPGIIGGLRSWLLRVQRSKTARARDSEMRGNEGISPVVVEQKAEKPSTAEEAPKSVAA
jgi:hypothetical protein